MTDVRNSPLSPWHKKLRLARAWIRGYPVWCTWQVTSRCNFRCDFCPYWQDRTPLHEMTDVAGFRRGARRLSHFGSLLISLAGGEPLLRNDLPDLVAAVAAWHFPFVTTNGWLVTRHLARELWKAGLWGASVSLDYAQSAGHDRHRGRPGAFDRAVAAIEALVAERQHPFQRVNVMCVLTEDNLDQIEPLLGLANRLGSYFMVQPYGWMKTGQRRQGPRGPVGPFLRRLHRRYANFLSNPWFLGRFDEYFHRGGVPGCLAGRAFFNIDCHGRVARCVEFADRPVGRLDALEPEALAGRLRREARRNRCQGCWYNCRGEVEMLYSPLGVLCSLPSLIFDRGRALRPAPRPGGTEAAGPPPAATRPTPLPQACTR